MKPMDIQGIDAKMLANVETQHCMNNYHFCIVFTLFTITAPRVAYMSKVEVIELSVTVCMCIYMCVGVPKWYPDVVLLTQILCNNVKTVDVLKKKNIYNKI